MSFGSCSRAEWMYPNRAASCCIGRFIMCGKSGPLLGIRRVGGSRWRIGEFRFQAIGGPTVVRLCGVTKPSRAWTNGEWLRHEQ